MTRSSIRRTLEQNELKPHKLRMWLHSPDPKFRKKVNNVVSFYRSPPEDPVVLCVGEKTGMQAIERKHETRRSILRKPPSLPANCLGYIRCEQTGRWEPGDQLRWPFGLVGEWL